MVPPFSGVAGQVNYIWQSGHTLLQIDSNGDKSGGPEILLHPNSALDHDEGPQTNHEVQQEFVSRSRARKQSAYQQRRKRNPLDDFRSRLEHRFPFADHKLPFGGSPHRLGGLWPSAFALTSFKA
jgi:hypothetical protein